MTEVGEIRGTDVPPGLGHRLWAACRRAWPVLRFVVGLVLAGLVLYELGGRKSELSGLSDTLGHLRVLWLFPAVTVEAAAMVAMAGVQYRLLSIGGLRTPRAPLLGVTLASQAITDSLPAGTAIGYVYLFRWYRRFGADDGLSGWVVFGGIVASGLSLALVAAAGLALAADQGAHLDLIPAVVGVLIFSALVAYVFVVERPLIWVITTSLHFSRKVIGRPRGDLAVHINRVVQRIRLFHVGWRDGLAVVGWALCGWLCDCSCLVFAFLVVGAPIPWGALLLAYGAGQLAANLPITPGGLGTVEGSITLALVAFGAVHSTAVDAVIIYRLISFWLVLLVGWSSWGVMAFGVRRGRWPRRALSAPLEESLPPLPWLVADPVLTTGAESSSN